MKIGLACSVCGRLNLLRAAKCDLCAETFIPSFSQNESFSQAQTLPTSSPTYHPTTPPASLSKSVATLYPPVSSSATVVASAHEVRFDPATGQPLAPAPAPLASRRAAKTMLFGALQQQAVVPRLVVIKGEGSDGITYHLSGTNHIVGRTQGDIQFREDPFLTPTHAQFTAQDGRLFVKNLSHTNGVFIRIKSPVYLEHEDCFLVGEQLLQILSNPLPDGSPDANGTYAYSSPHPMAKFRVLQHLAGGGEGRMVPAQENSLSIGRENNQLNFPKDRFISGRHARLDAASDSHHIILTDTGSRNGTFLRIRGVQELFHGDYLFIGQQLLRVEIT